MCCLAQGASIQFYDTFSHLSSRREKFDQSVPLSQPALASDRAKCQCENQRMRFEENLYFIRGHVGGAKIDYSANSSFSLALGT